MSRGFDGFEIDDFRDPGSDSGRDIGRGSSSNWNARTRLYYVHRAEDRADRIDREGRQLFAQSVRRWLARNASKRFSLTVHEANTRTGTKTIPSGFRDSYAFGSWQVPRRGREGPGRTGLQRRPCPDGERCREPGPPGPRESRRAFQIASTIPCR